MRYEIKPAMTLEANVASAVKSELDTAIFSGSYNGTIEVGDVIAKVVPSWVNMERPHAHIVLKQRPADFDRTELVSRLDIEHGIVATVA